MSLAVAPHSTLGKEEKKKAADDENHASSSKNPFGKRYCELQRQIPGAVLATKTHQGGLNDKQDESDGKMFEVPGSPRCPVQTVKNFISHLNAKMEFVFQRPRLVSNKFNP